jgi:hypothetical protein
MYQEIEIFSDKHPLILRYTRGSVNSPSCSLEVKGLPPSNEGRYAAWRAVLTSIKSCSLPDGITNDGGDDSGRWGMNKFNLFGEEMIALRHKDLSPKYEQTRERTYYARIQSTLHFNSWHYGDIWLPGDSDWGGTTREMYSTEHAEQAFRLALSATLMFRLLGRAFPDSTWTFESSLGDDLVEGHIANGVLAASAPYTAAVMEPVTEEYIFI